MKRADGGHSMVEVSTPIRAPIERCFNLARSIDLHAASASSTQERVVAGRTSGLIGLGERVTFRARHFGVWLTHSSLITAYESPFYFRDEMTEGFFRYFAHEHRFTSNGEITLMLDLIELRSKFGPLSRVIDPLIIVPHLRRFLLARNKAIRSAAEADEWKRYLNET
jgi:ligand-binding SRPBCC domain-containing protein